LGADGGARLKVRLGASVAVAAAFALSIADAFAGRPRCLYGQVIDGHSGTVRCLSPEEVSPPGPYDTPAEPQDAGPDADAGRDGASSGPRRDAGLDTGLDATGDAMAPTPLRPGHAAIVIDAVAFDGGDVPRAPAALERIKKDFARCIENAPAPKADASIELKFLVRGPGRAEGVDVVQSRGVPSDIVRCVTSSLSGRPVGAPTNDPVVVSVTIRFKKD
jgi:hypothetical protein